MLMLFLYIQEGTWEIKWLKSVNTSFKVSINLLD